MFAGMMGVGRGAAYRAMRASTQTYARSALTGAAGGAMLGGATAEIVPGGNRFWGGATVGATVGAGMGMFGRSQRMLGKFGGLRP